MHCALSTEHSARSSLEAEQEREQERERKRKQSTNLLLDGRPDVDALLLEHDAAFALHREHNKASAACTLCARHIP